MKKQIFLLLVSAIAYCSCTKSPAQSLCDGETGASPKDIQTQKVTVGDFNAISATSSVDVVYIPSDDETSVEIRASKAVLPYISVQVDAHGTLVVGMKKPKDPTKTKGIKEVHVKARPVGSLSASSSGDIFVKDGLHVKGTLRLTAGSSGDISCQDISCKDLHATSNSSGDISGKSVSCGLLTAASNSSGDIYFGGSKCQQADLQCNSSGDLHIKGLECTHLIATATSSQIYSLEQRRPRCRQYGSPACGCQCLFGRRHFVPRLGIAECPHKRRREHRLFGESRASIRFR